MDANDSSAGNVNAAASGAFEPGGGNSEVRNLESLLGSLCERTSGETVSVRDLLDAVGRRAYGPILTLLGFVAVSPLTIVPGANSIVALVVLVIALQMAFGKRYPWVPSRLLDMAFPREKLVEGVKGAQRYARFIDRLLAPRLTFLTEPPFAMIIAVICVAAALVTIPLSFVPLGPIVPSLAILLFGLGVTGRDGVFILLAGAALTGAGLLLVKLGGALPF